MSAGQGAVSPSHPEGESPEARDQRNFYGEPLLGQTESPEVQVSEQVREWLRERMGRVLKEENYCDALDALAISIRPEFLPLDFPQTLTGLACLAVSPSRWRWSRKAWETVWTRNTGKTWKALREFPDRVCGMADEIKRLNESFAFSAVQYASAQTVEAVTVRKVFNQLPAMLGAYAEALRWHIDRVPLMTAEAFPPLPRGHSKFVVYVSELIKAATGRFRDRECARLLNAAALALDEKAEFDALTIAQARSRSRKSRKT